MITRAQTLQIIGGIMYVLPTNLNIRTRALFVYFDSNCEQNGQLRPPQLVALVQFKFVGSRQLDCSFLRMENIYKKIKEVILCHPFISSSVIAYVTLLLSHHVWWAFTLGATTITIIFANIPKLEAKHLAEFLAMYAVLFVVVLMPVALLLQSYYDIGFLSKRDYKYFTSEIYAD